VRAIAELALRRPWALLGANLAAAAVAVAAALGAPGDLGIGSTRLDGQGPETVVVLLERNGTGPGVLAVAGEVVAAQLEADPAFGEVRADQEDERRTALLAELEPTSAAAREEAVERISDRIDPGPLRATVGGETATRIEAKRALGTDLWRLELLVLPLVLLLAAAAAGPRAAVAPIVCTVTAIAGSLALLRLTGIAVEVSLLAVVPAAAVGATLGIELPALVARLYREEAAIWPTGDAMRHSLAQAGPLLGGAAALGSLPAVSLLATPLDQAPALALGCALAAALAAASALTATPAVLVIFGEHRPTEADGNGGAGRLAEAIRSAPARAASTRARCALLAIASLAVGLVLAYPALDGVSRTFLPGDLPAGSDVARASLAIAQGGAPGDSLFPELPLAAAAAAALLAAALALITRSPGALLAVPFALLPAATGLGACVYVLGEGHLAGAIGSDGRGALDNAAVAGAVAALGAIGAARAWIALQAARAERRLGAAPEGAAEVAARLTLPGAAAAALAGAALGAALIGAELAVAGELGFALSVGLLVDLVLVRTPLLAAVARWG
jgi:uncharacterized membrane protein YdfJ with MMPL/SSD domain